MVRRTPEQAEETRNAILRAAREQFSEHGYEVSLANITEAAGVTKGALFHHFPSKFELFRAVWRALQIEMDNAARDAALEARSKTDPYAAFLAGARTYLEWAQRQDYQRIVLIEGRAVLGIAEWHQADYELGKSNVFAGVQYLAGKGLIAQERSAALGVLFQSALNGAGFLLSRNDTDITVDDIFDAFESLLRNAR